MTLHISLLVLIAVYTGLGGGTKSESHIFGMNELEACFLNKPLTMNCRDEVCVMKKCLKQGYDSLFENSSYSLKRDHDVSRTAHCAVDKCVKGLMEGIEDEHWMFSGWMEPILFCLYSVSSCVNNHPRDEL